MCALNSLQELRVGSIGPPDNFAFRADAYSIRVKAQEWDKATPSYCGIANAVMYYTNGKDDFLTG